MTPAEIDVEKSVLPTVDDRRAMPLLVSGRSLGSEQSGEARLCGEFPAGLLGLQTGWTPTLAHRGRIDILTIRPASARFQDFAPQSRIRPRGGGKATVGTLPAVPQPQVWSAEISHRASWVPIFSPIWGTHPARCGCSLRIGPADGSAKARISRARESLIDRCERNIATFVEPSGHSNTMHRSQSSDLAVAAVSSWRWI